jgi:histone H3/H4
MIDKYLCDYVKFLLKKNQIIIKDDKTISYLTEYIENIIFNIVSIAAIITFINNSKIIQNESITLINKYLKSSCGNPKKSMKGGNSIVMPSEFYGYDSHRYSTINNQTDYLQVDLNSGILRPQIGGGGKKKTDDNKPINKAIKEILKYYKLKISKDCCCKLLKLIEDYIKCLMSKLKEVKGNITKTCINKIIKSEKTFDIFK